MSYSWTIVNRLSISVDEKELFKKAGIEHDFYCDSNDLCEAVFKKCKELEYNLIEFDGYDLTFTFELNWVCKNINIARQQAHEFQIVSLSL